MRSEWRLGENGLDGAPRLPPVMTVAGAALLRLLDDLGEADQKVIEGDGAQAEFADAWRINNVGVSRR